jgi:hypothetical protein
MGQELGSASHLEMTMEHRHVLMDRRLAQAEPSRDLLLAVAVEETGERLPQSGRQPLRARFEGADGECPISRPSS